MLEGFLTLVFDCDGVVLDSNKVKTEAFRRAALPYGEDAAQAIVEHHVANGGISRYRKFEYFLDNLAPGARRDGELDQLLASYASYVREGLMTCDIASDLYALRTAWPQSTWMIVSGGDQSELREVFAARGLTSLFNGGIFGSPDSKDDILAREIGRGAIAQPAMFLGDSKYDHEVALRFGLDFIFISNWSEVSDAPTWLEEHKITSLPSLKDLLCPADCTPKAGSSASERTL
ncbi:HAD family hydrolase [Plastorhodobacter daqingensis]|uniref:phosphoglycolate phosphatase n=1 Tax=Plastorhodobacter daqingensis TaxID=1387281 RepID=A0ABW2UQT4_9RHOB